MFAMDACIDLRHPLSGFDLPNYRVRVNPQSDRDDIMLIFISDRDADGYVPQNPAFTISAATTSDGGPNATFLVKVTVIGRALAGRTVAGRRTGRRAQTRP